MNYGLEFEWDPMNITLQYAHKKAVCITLA